MLKTLLSGGGRMDMRRNLTRLHDRYGPVARQGRGRIRFVNLFGPDANRFVLMDRERIFSARRPWMQIMGDIFPNGLLLKDGAEHRNDRKIMHTAFTRPVLREYAERMNPVIESGIEGWAREGQDFRAFDAFKELTLGLASQIFVGVDLGVSSRAMNSAFEEMVAASMPGFRIPLPGFQYRRGLDARAYIVKTFRGMLEKKRANSGPDIFSRLCHARSEDGEILDDSAVIDHMSFLMMAAHDTTTSTLSSLMYELARNPGWQDRVRDESVALGESHPAFDDLDRLESLTWAMKETLRRYPALPVIPRVATREFEFGGYRIPERAMVVVSPIHTHHMPEYWDDPDRFDPLRFSPARAEHERHTHSWIPFGGGPHMCLGSRFAETLVRAVMHQLLRRYRWTVPDGYEMPVQQAPISKPRDGLPVQLVPLAG